MSDDLKTKERIIEAMKVHATAGKIPKRLHIPRLFEAEMCLLGENEVGRNLAATIMKDGPRKALQGQGNTLFGMEIVWDAADFRVEAE